MQVIQDELVALEQGAGDLFPVLQVRIVAVSWSVSVRSPQRKAALQRLLWCFSAIQKQTMKW